MWPIEARCDLSSGSRGDGGQIAVRAALSARAPCCRGGSLRVVPLAQMVTWMRVSTRCGPRHPRPPPHPAARREAPACQCAAASAAPERAPVAILRSWPAIDRARRRRRRPRAGPAPARATVMACRSSCASHARCVGLGCAECRPSAGWRMPRQSGTSLALPEIAPDLGADQPADGEGRASSARVDDSEGQRCQTGEDPACSKRNMLDNQTYEARESIEHLTGSVMASRGPRRCGSAARRAQRRPDYLGDDLRRLTGEAQ